MDEKYLRSRARTQALLSVLVLGGVLVAQIIAVLFIMLLGISEESLWAAILPQLFSAVWAVVGVVLLGGRRLAKPTADDIGHAFRFGWLCIAVSVALLIFEVVTYVSEGAAVDPQWPIKLTECALLCLLVGFHEEFVFRGLIFHGLLGLMGGTHKGVVRAVFVSALIFGTMHLDISSDLVSPITCLQAVLKVVQTGMFGILMCAISLRKRRLVGTSLLHGADDFILMAVSIGLFSEPFDTAYTTEGEEAISTIILYVIVILCYLPFTIKSLREIRDRGYVYRGEFMEHEVARVRAWERQRQEAELAQAQGMAWAQGDVQGAAWAQGPVGMQPVPPAQVPGPVRVQSVPLAQVPGTVHAQPVPLAQMPQHMQSPVQPQAQASYQVQTQPSYQAQASYQPQAQPPYQPQAQVPYQAQTQAPYQPQVQTPQRPTTAPYSYDRRNTPPAPKGLA